MVHNTDTSDGWQPRSPNTSHCIFNDEHRSHNTAVNSQTKLSCCGQLAEESIEFNNIGWYSHVSVVTQVHSIWQKSTWCTNRSSPPPLGVMKPKPLVASNHFTVLQKQAGICELGQKTEEHAVISTTSKHRRRNWTDANNQTGFGSSALAFAFKTEVVTKYALFG